MKKFAAMNARIGTLDDLERNSLPQKASGEQSLEQVSLEQVSLEEPGWIYEPKLDGIRALCYIDKSGRGKAKVRFISRNDLDLTDKYPELAIADCIQAETCVLDGEIVAYDAKGIPRFSLLQQGHSATYVIFDVLFCDGTTLTNMPLLERKDMLHTIVKETKKCKCTCPLVPYTYDGKALWKEAKKHGLEGVMAKQADSLYYPGKRKGVWLKIKLFSTMDCVIVGFTQKKRIVSSLALGIYDNNELRYIGKVGTGFSLSFLSELYPKLKRLARKTNPTVNKDDSPDDGISWVRPELVAEVKYLEVTKAGMLRSPVFERLRFDKEPQDCTLKSQTR